MDISNQHTVDVQYLLGSLFSFLVTHLVNVGSIIHYPKGMLQEFHDLLIKFLSPQVSACGSSILLSSQTPTLFLTTWQSNLYHTARQDRCSHSGQLKCHKWSTGLHPLDTNHSITALTGRLRIFLGVAQCICALKKSYRRKQTFTHGMEIRRCVILNFF